MPSEPGAKIKAVDLKVGMRIEHYFTTAFGTHKLVGELSEVDDQVTGSGIPYVRLRFDEAACSDVHIDRQNGAQLYGDGGLKMCNYVAGLLQSQEVIVIDWGPWPSVGSSGATGDATP